MAPLAESVFMPFMTDGKGAQWIGGWFGTGPDRGLGLMFTMAGVLGVAATVRAWTSGSYRRLAPATALDGAAAAPAGPLADCAA